MRLPISILLSLSFASLGSGPASAGVIVVDAANGPGAQFTDLGAAIAAATDGDVLLLRSGTYPGPLAVTTKALSFVAEDGATVLVASTGAVPFLPAFRFSASTADDVVVRGLEFAAAPATFAAALRVESTAGGGTTFLEECYVAQSGDAGIVADGVRPVVLARCDARGRDGIHGLSAAPARMGVYSTGAPLAMFGGAARGGDGADVFTVARTAGGAGAAGFESANPFAVPKVLAAVELRGGDGGDGAFFTNCHPPGAGGHGGLVVLNGGVHAIGVHGAGGFPGLPGAGCAASSAGDLLANTFLGLPPVVDPATPALLTLPRVRTGGAAAAAVVTGTPGDELWLVLGASPAFFVALPSGVLAVDPRLVVPLGILPPSGTLSLAGVAPQLPPGLSHFFVFGQVISRAAGGPIVIGSPTAMLVLP